MSYPEQITTNMYIVNALAKANLRNNEALKYIN